MAGLPGALRSSTAELLVDFLATVFKEGDGRPARGCAAQGRGKGPLQAMRLPCSYIHPDLAGVGARSLAIVHQEAGMWMPGTSPFDIMSTLLLGQGMPLA